MNDVFLTWLFVGTFKWVAIEWFLKLPQESIKSWSDLERLLLLRFFKDNLEINTCTLLSTK